jgi:uncharacterized protein YkwD
MPRIIVRTVLAGIPSLLILGLAGPIVLGSLAPSRGAIHPQAMAAAMITTIRSAGLAGPDRLTAAAVAEAKLHEVPPPSLADQPASAAPAWRAASGAAPAPPAPPAPPAATASSPVGGAAGQGFALINQDRAANGVRTVSWSATLARVAQYRAQDMLDRGYFSHYDPASGQLAFVQLFQAWGIGYTAAGENIAWSTDPSMAAINTMFMNSPEHRANILNPAYGRAGVGVASNGAKVIVVEVFSN